MPKNAWRVLANVAIAFVIALAVWWGLSVPYTRLLASLSAAAIRLLEQPAVTVITPQETLMVVDRTDLTIESSSARLGVESTGITGNFVLLMTLFAATRHALSDRNVFRFAGAAIVLLIIHVGVVISFVKADYATRFGSWSVQHYGPVSRALWVAAPYFYSVVGVYGAAFALWWLLRPLPRVKGRA